MAVANKTIVLKEGEYIYVEIETPRRRSNKVYRIENVEGTIECIDVGKIQKATKGERDGRE